MIEEGRAGVEAVSSQSLWHFQYQSHCFRRFQVSGRCLPVPASPAFHIDLGCSCPRYAEELGLNVSTFLATHMHFDHVGGAAPGRKKKARSGLDPRERPES